METQRNSRRNKGEEQVKKFFSILWFMITAPFHGDFWDDEEAFTAYFGCIFGTIVMVIWFTVVCLFIYGLYLGVQYLETLL